MLVRGSGVAPVFACALAAFSKLTCRACALFGHRARYSSFALIPFSFSVYFYGQISKPKRHRVQTYARRASDLPCVND